MFAGPGESGAHDAQKLLLKTQVRILRIEAKLIIYYSVSSRWTKYQHTVGVPYMGFFIKKLIYSMVNDSESGTHTGKTPNNF